MNLCAVSIATIKSTKKNLHFFNGDNNKTTAPGVEELYNVNENSDSKRPYVKAKVNGYGRNFLYDTGASRTCIKLDTFKKMFPNGHPRKLLSSITADLLDAGGNSLGLVGVFLMPFEIMGRSFMHEVRVLKHVTEDIIGIDLIHKQRLFYDPVQRDVFFSKSNSNCAISMATQTFMPSLTKKIVKVNYHGEPDQNKLHVATIYSDESKLIQGGPALLNVGETRQCYIEIANCAPFDIYLSRGSIIGMVEEEEKEFLHKMDGGAIDNFISEISSKQKPPPGFEQICLTREQIEKRANLNVPAQYREKYLDLLVKYARAISVDKNDLGRAKDFFHRIHLKDNAPVYRKQFPIPEAHTDFIEATLEEWLRIGVVRQSKSLYNSPIFCVPKKTGQGLRIVQDFRELNDHCHIDKYSMKEINECIGEIGRAHSTIFTTLDLTSGFWQMPLHPDDAHTTAFSVPGRGQFEWITSPMGLLGCPASFQRMMEHILQKIKNVIVYIDDVLIHSKSHDEMLIQLALTFERLQRHGMKVNLEKCYFGNTEVSYLGFVLTPQGITPGKDKLKAIKEAKPPTDMKAVRSFIGLCNFFRTHIKNFAIISAPLTKLTRKDSGYHGGPLPADALKAFHILKQQLVSNPVVAYPRSDRQYALIVDASTGSATEEGGLGAILTQIDEEGKFHVISYGSRQLVKHEKNYSPYLLEMQAGIWGMDFYANYLRGKRFILYTDHKPLENLGHLHKKTLNRLQIAMNEFDFEIRYKKGINMPADYLSRYTIAALNEFTPQVDPFTPDLQALQAKDPDLVKIQYFFSNGKWPMNTTKAEIRRLLPITTNFVNEKNTIWVRLNDHDYPRVALFLPQVFRKKAICQAHGSLLSGHDALDKTYIRLTSSFFWPTVKTDIQKHIDSCLQCQQRKKSTAKPLPLQTLPTVDSPNYRIHIDLFGPLKTSSQGNKMILCITDAFTKYAEVIAIPDKHAETVANELMIHWICRYGTPIQIHSDNGKEFVNKLSKELFQLLGIKHSTTTPAHPQCNAQVEVFNKTVAKYLASFVDNSTLDWEQYIPALMFSYNTSYHSTIHTTPYELLYGMKPRTPSLPATDIQRKFYGESFASERLQILQKAREIAKANIEKSQEKYKHQHDKKAEPHTFSIGQQVWYSQTDFLNVNKKLAPKWIGPATIIEINESVAKIKLQNNRTKTLNVKRLKLFIPKEDTQDDQDTQDEENDAEDSESNQESTKINLEAFQNNRPRTRAWAKLINNDAASTLIEEEIKYKLNNIAYKLYHLKFAFKQLTSQEQQLWKSFPLCDIYEWLTGDPYTPPDYNEYIRFRSTTQPGQPQLQPQAPQPNQIQPPPVENQQNPGPAATPPPKKRGRPPGSKNKPKDPLTRFAHYASKRLTRNTSNNSLNKE
jgi:hypothetical protein